MKSLVTGGAGFIGSYLVEILLAKGQQVFVVDDLSTGSLKNLEVAKSKAADNQLVIYEKSIFESILLDRLVAQCDHVYHLAAAVGVKNIVEHPLASIQCNVKGTELVLEACHKYRKKVYVASTSEVYGKLEQVPFHEESGSFIGSSAKLRWSYAASKLMDEFLAIAYYRETGLPVVIGRHFNTVGPRQSSFYGMVIPKFIEQAMTNKPITIFGDGNQSRTFTHVTEVADIVYDLMHHDKAVGEVFNIGGVEEISINQLAQKIKALTKSKSPVEHIPLEKVYNKDFEDMPRRVPDCSKLAKVLGHAPTMGLDKILMDSVNYFAEVKAL